MMDLEFDYPARINGVDGVLTYSPYEGESITLQVAQGDQLLQVRLNRVVHPEIFGMLVALVNAGEPVDIYGLPLSVDDMSLPDCVVIGDAAAPVQNALAHYDIMVQAAMQDKGVAFALQEALTPEKRFW